MYKLYRRPVDKVLDAFGASRLFFWRKNDYQGFWALRDLDLEVRRGERLGIIGRNGAGKSTLLKVITGNISPTEGSLTVHGRVQALLELGTGFHPEFTGRQNIRASLAYQGLSAGQIAGKEEEIIDFAELEEFIDQPVKTYSAGMYARLAFSTATVIEPEVLIIDEVLGAGDAYFAGKCLERMRKLTDESGATVLFVSHDLGSVQQLCERVIWIDRGRIKADGQPLEVTKAYYASILQQEEARLRARNARLARRQMKDLQAKEEAEHVRELLFRLVTATGLPPKGHVAISRIVLSSPQGYREEVAPGQPMDNDASQPAYLMADRRYMLWGDPVLHEGERVRCFEATGGIYGHAPIVFGVPRHLYELGEFELEVSHRASAVAEEAVNVEYYDGERYRLVGVLRPCSGRETVQKFPSLDLSSGPNRPVGFADAPASAQKRETNLVEASPGNEDSVVLKQRDGEKFYSDWAEFMRLGLVDDRGREQAVFQIGETIGVTAEIEVRQRIAACTFSVAVYSLTNIVISSLSWPIAGGLAPGKYRWTVLITEPNLRQSTYVLSCALIRTHSSLTNENLVYYSRWNRALSLRIEEGHIGGAPQGVVLLQTRPPAGAPLSVASCEKENAELGSGSTRL